MVDYSLRSTLRLIHTHTHVNIVKNKCRKVVVYLRMKRVNCIRIACLMSTAYFFPFLPCFIFQQLFDRYHSALVRSFFRPSPPPPLISNILSKHYKKIKIKPKHPFVSCFTKEVVVFSYYIVTYKKLLPNLLHNICMYTPIFHCKSFRRPRTFAVYSSCVS